MYKMREEAIFWQFKLERNAWSWNGENMKLKCCLHMKRKGVPKKYWKHWAMASETMESCKDCNLENMVYPQDDLDQMRNQMYEMEQELRKFGLPERTGFSCWNFKLFKTACEEFPKGRSLFKECADLHVRFYMAHRGFEGKIEEFAPHKTDPCANRVVKMLNHMRENT